MTEIKWNFRIDDLNGKVLAVGSLQTFNLSLPTRYFNEQAEIYKPCQITITNEEGKSYSKTFW